MIGHRYKTHFKGWKSGLFVCSFWSISLFPGFGYEYQIRIRIQESQTNADPNPQHWKQPLTKFYWEWSPAYSEHARITKNINPRIHTVKKCSRVSRPQPGCHYQTLLSGNNDVITELFLPIGSLVSDIPAGDGKLVNLFLRCRASWRIIENLSNTALSFGSYSSFFHDWESLV